MQECAASGVVLAVFGEAAVHVGQAGADAVLVPLQSREVDSVREVRREKLVGFGFQTCPVRAQVRDFLILARVAFVERRIQVSGEALIGGVADRDRGVGVRDQALGDRDGHRASRAVRLLRGAAGADEVGVGGAARVGGEVEQLYASAAQALHAVVEPNPWSCIGIYARIFGEDTVRSNPGAYVNARPTRQTEDATRTAQHARAEAEKLRALTPAEAVERITQTRAAEGDCCTVR